jgi:hypothetical protein
MTQTVQRKSSRSGQLNSRSNQQNITSRSPNRNRNRLNVPPEFRQDVSKLPELPGHAADSLRDNITLLLRTAQTVMEDSPAAAVGIASILSSYNHPFRTFALSEMLEFLQHAQWTPQLQAIATSAVRQETGVYHRFLEEGKPYNVEGLLKLQLREQEYRLVSYFLGNTRNISNVGQTCSSIATEMRLSTESEKSQAVAHVIAATANRFSRPGNGPGVLSWRSTWEELKMAAPIIATYWDVKGVVEAIEQVSSQ